MLTIARSQVVIILYSTIRLPTAASEPIAKRPFHSWRPAFTVWTLPYTTPTVWRRRQRPKYRRVFRLGAADGGRQGTGMHSAAIVQYVPDARAYIDFQKFYVATSCLASDQERSPDPRVRFQGSCQTATVYRPLPGRFVASPKPMLVG